MTNVLPAIPVRKAPNQPPRQTMITPELPSLLSTQLSAEIYQTPELSRPDTRDNSPEYGFTSPLRRRLSKESAVAYVRETEVIQDEETGSGYTVQTLMITARLFAQGIINDIDILGLSKADREMLDKEIELERRREKKRRERQERVLGRREKRVEETKEAKRKLKQKAWEFYNKQACTIQRYFLGYCARRNISALRDSKSTKVLASIRIQREARAFLARKVLASLRASKLRAMRKERIRGFVKRQSILRIRSGLPLFKGNIEAGEFDLEEAYAVYIQRVVRGFLGRRKARRAKALRDQNRRRKEAALVLQKLYRGYAARKHFANIKYNRGALQFQQQMSRFERAMKNMERRVDERRQRGRSSTTTKQTKDKRTQHSALKNKESPGALKPREASTSMSQLPSSMAKPHRVARS